MTDEERERGLSIPDKVWRLQERQADIRKRLDKHETRLEKLESRPWSASLFTDSGLVRMIIYGLLAAVVGLATGQVVNLGG